MNFASFRRCWKDKNSSNSKHFVDIACIIRLFGSNDQESVQVSTRADRGTKRTIRTVRWYFSVPTTTLLIERKRPTSKLGNRSPLEIQKEITRRKKTPEYQWLNDVPSQIPQQAVQNVDRAFDGYFKKRSGFPKFKKKRSSVQSFRIPHHEALVFESLNVKGMTKTKLSKSIHDTAFGEIRRQAEYKGIWYDVPFITVDRWFPSSKLCSVCGSINNDLSLSDREWRCPKCGTDHDRDINAAQNLRMEGRSILAAGSTESINAYGVRVRLALPAVNSEVGIPHYSRTAA
jgi:IS605 OrfB family transposase